jgi:hypothetical protein
MLRLSQTNVPPRVGGGAVEQVAEKSREILLGPAVTDHALDFAGGDVKGRNQGLSAVAAVLGSGMQACRRTEQGWRRLANGC